MKILLIAFLSLISLNLNAAEGVSTEVDPSKLTQVEKWIENAKYDLDIGIDDISKGPITEREERFRNLIVQVLEKSGKNSNEFLMRNMLYRTQVVYSSLQKSVPSEKRDAVSRKVLEEGVRWASSLYQADLSLIGSIKNKTAEDYTPGVAFATLGLEWAEYMFGLYYDIPDNKMRFELLKDLMGLMYNDVNSDSAVNRILAPVSKSIVQKNEEIKQIPNIPRTPQEELELARSLRTFIETHIDETRALLEPYAVNFYGEGFRASPGDIGDVARTLSFESVTTPGCSRASSINEKLQVIENGSKIRFLPHHNSDLYYVEVIDIPSTSSPMGAQVSCKGFLTKRMLSFGVKRIFKRDAEHITRIKTQAKTNMIHFVIAKKNERLKKYCRYLDRNTNVVLVDFVKYYLFQPTRPSGLGPLFDLPSAEVYYLVRVDDQNSMHYGCTGYFPASGLTILD
ncbi:MAG: hypothetical protein V4596_03595 [Bdellovibrionota bacterium]